MRILFINEVCGTGSTGKITCELAEKYEREGHEVKVAYGRNDNVPEKYKRFAVRIGSMFDVYVHAVMTRLTDRHGFYSGHATRKFLRWAEEYNPDFLWLHNIHGYYINIEMLFEWIKQRQDMKIYWTLHDCWSFTGHCAYFTMAGCDKWQSHCERCPQKSSYPSSLADNSYSNFEDKRRLFTGIKNLTLITPSKWLADLTRKSFLREYPVEVRYNTIDTNIFKPTPGNFRERYNLQDKIIILGVASIWEKRKGLDDFLKLSAMLDDRYAIVLVGLTPKQIKALPKNIIAIERTNNQKELAEIYTASDVYVNPSLEETFGMTTFEAQACGTKAVVYKGTACEEVAEKFGGTVINPDAESIYHSVILLTGGGGITGLHSQNSEPEGAC